MSFSGVQKSLHADALALCQWPRVASSRTEPSPRKVVSTLQRKSTLNHRGNARNSELAARQMPLQNVQEHVNETDMGVQTRPSLACSAPSRQAWPMVPPVCH